MFSFLIMGLLGAFLWRLRGGLLNDLTGKPNYPILGIPFNDTVVRSLWSIGMAGALWGFGNLHQGLINLGIIALHDYYNVRLLWCDLLGAIIIGLSLFFGTSAIGWMGYSITPTKWRDVLGLSGSGLARMALPAVLLLSPWLVIAGSLFGPAYWLGNKTPKKYPWLFWGEFYCGFIIGFCLRLS